MDLENIQPLYEDCRTLLMDSEPISNEIEKVTNSQLQESIKEIFRTAQSDLLILTDFLIEVMNCQNESELQMLLDLNQDYSEVVN